MAVVAVKVSLVRIVNCPHSIDAIAVIVILPILHKNDLHVSVKDVEKDYL